MPREATRWMKPELCSYEECDSAAIFVVGLLNGSEWKNWSACADHAADLAELAADAIADGERNVKGSD